MICVSYSLGAIEVYPGGITIDFLVCLEHIPGCHYSSMFFRMAGPFNCTATSPLHGLYYENSSLHLPTRSTACYQKVKFHVQSAYFPTLSIRCLDHREFSFAQKCFGSCAEFQFLTHARVITKKTMHRLLDRKLFNVIMYNESVSQFRG